MLIPSIDLMGGKIVQLIQGSRKALEFDDFDEWIARFSSFPLVQLIDLDAAMGTGNNRTLVCEIVRRLPCQVGGGVRSISAARQLLEAGAQRVIVGSRLIREGDVDQAFADELAAAVGSDHIICALDSKKGKVAIEGWQVQTSITALFLLQALDPWFGSFLYTNIDTEGLLQGIPLDCVCELRQATQRQLMVAGGISSQTEIDLLDQMGVDAIVGMAIYKRILTT